MSTNTIAPDNGSKTEPAAPKRDREARSARPMKKPAHGKKPAGKAKADRANKKAEVIEMMKRAKGATLPEIMKATGW